MIKSKLMMAASNATPPVPANKLYSWTANLNGSTAQNTATGTTTVPTVVTPATSPTLTWLMIESGSVAAFSPSGTSTVALRSDGTIWSWGPNYTSSVSTVDGCIGQGSVITERLVPTQIGTDTDWVWVSQSANGGVAIKSNGTAWSWGLNTTSGNLGQGASGARYYVPTQIGADTNWVKSFSGLTSLFLLKSTGTLWVCGANTSYQTGRGINTGNTTTITQIGTDTDWAFVSCKNPGNTIAIKTTGAAWSWGVDTAGELFQGATGNYTTPTQIGVATDWAKVETSVKTSNRASYLIKTDNTLWVAGSNVDYQTGLNTNAGNTLTPTQVGALSYSKVVSVGLRTSTVGAVALATDGKLYSWGPNANYYLGNGLNSGNVQVPTQIGSLSDWNGVYGSGAVFATRYG